MRPTENVFSGSISSMRRLPEPDTVRQSFSISWTGQQFEKEVGIMFVEGPQAFGHDPDELMFRGRRRGRGCTGWARRNRSGGPRCDHRGRDRTTAFGAWAGLLVDGLLGQEMPEIIGQILGGLNTAPRHASTRLSGRCDPVLSGCRHRTAVAAGPRNSSPAPSVPLANPHETAGVRPAVRRRRRPG